MSTMIIFGGQRSCTRSIKTLPRLKSDLHASILDVFKENHVQIMTPSYVANPEAPKIAPTIDIKEVAATEL
jgi:hypothetical protein